MSTQVPPPTAIQLRKDAVAYLALAKMFSAGGAAHSRATRAASACQRWAQEIEAQDTHVMAQHHAREDRMKDDADRVSDYQIDNPCCDDFK